MELKLADNSHKNEIIDLWKYCFYDTDPYLSWYFNNIYRAENTVVALENGKLAAALQMTALNIVTRGKSQPCHYLCGVSVAPWARADGVGSAILKYADQVSKDRGAKYNILIPALDGFYEKNGYVRCYEKTQYSYNPNEFRPKNPGCNIRRAERTDVSHMLDVYKKYTSAFDGYIDRNLECMKNIFDMYSLFTGGSILFGDSGYIFYYIENKTMYIDEAVCTDLKSAEGVLSFIGSHSSQVNSVVLRTGERDIFSTLLNILAVKSSKIHNVVMKPLYDEPIDMRVKVGQIDSRTAQMMKIDCDDNYGSCKNFINILQ